MWHNQLYSTVAFYLTDRPRILCSMDGYCTVDSPTTATIPCGIGKTSRSKKMLLFSAIVDCLNCTSHSTQILPTEHLCLLPHPLARNFCLKGQWCCAIKSRPSDWINTLPELFCEEKSKFFSFVDCFTKYNSLMSFLLWYSHPPLFFWLYKEQKELKCPILGMLLEYSKIFLFITHSLLNKAQSVIFTSGKINLPHPSLPWLRF